MNAHIILRHSGGSAARVLLVYSASLIAVLLVVDEFDAHQWKCGRGVFEDANKSSSMRLQASFTWYSCGHVPFELIYEHVFNFLLQ